MAISRRARTAPGRSPSRTVPAAKPQGENTPEPSPVIPAVDPDEPDQVMEDAGEPVAEQVEAVPSSGSSRRGAARQSRRMQAQSSAKNVPFKKSDRILTPAEIEARRQARKGGIKLAIVLLLVIGASIAGWWFFLRTDPHENHALAQLREGQAKLGVVETAIANRQPADARAAFAAGIKALQVPELGNAKEPIDPKDPSLVSLPLAQKAVEVHKQIRATEERIDRVERDIKAENNKRRVVEGFGKIMELDEAGLVELEKRATLFMANPVEPDAGARDDYKTDYQDMISDIKNQMSRIEAEKDRRLASITSDQEKKAHTEIDVLVKQELFKEALTKLEDYAGKFEKGNFDSLKEFVKASAKQSWEQAKAYADSRYTDYKSPGIPEPLAKQALADARTRLQQVIDRFGIDEYVTAAKDQLGKFPAQ
jgi:hypothetical protein